MRAGIVSVAAKLKDIVQREGPSPSHEQLPLLSFGEVFRRERPRSDRGDFTGGDLIGGAVVVCETQPLVDVERAVHVRRNIDNGISYFYFFYLSSDTIEKSCQALQIICWAGVVQADGPPDFRARVETITSNRDRILQDLWDLCETGKLRIALLADEPLVCFRVHNASNPTSAQVYARYNDKGFALWTG
jgi:hypothetical protein